MIYFLFPIRKCEVFLLGTAVCDDHRFCVDMCKYILPHRWFLLWDNEHNTYHRYVCICNKNYDRIGMFVFAIRIMIARVSCCLHFCFFFNEKYFFCMDQKWPNRDPLVWMDKVFNSIEKIESKIPGFWIPGFSKKSCRYIGASIIPQAWFKEKSIMWWFLNKMKSYKL